MENVEKNNKKQILRSTFLMGTASVLNIVFGMLRHKILAMMISSYGLGLLGIYQSLVNLMTTIFGLGINESGARQIAISDAKDEQRLAETYLSIKRIAISTSIVGIIISVILSKPLSTFSFESSSYYLEIILLSFVILINNIYGAQAALIQGKRKISFLAKINILGAMWGTILSLPLFYYLKTKAIILYFIIMAATNLISSWWYSRKIYIMTIRSSWIKSVRSGIPLLNLGSALMIGTLVGYGTHYLIMTIIARYMGMESVGLYQASSIFSTIYVGILLKAMATDFYPRLSAAHNDRHRCSALVNDQIETGILLAIPGILLTLSFSSFLIIILYSKEFLPSISILRWQIVGVLIQIITWPLGYVLRAQGAGRLFLLTECLYNVSYATLVYLFAQLQNLEGIGIAFFLSNVIYLIVVFPIVNEKFGIRISKNLRMIIIISIFLLLLSIYLSIIIRRYYIFFNILVTLSVSIYTFGRLNIKEFLIKIKGKFRHN